YTGNIDAPEPWMHWELDAFPHRMINGKTGGGKSTPMRCTQLHGVVTGAELFVFSGKKSGEFGWLRRRGLASIASTPPGWAFMADHLWSEFQRRQQLLEDSGLEWWWEHPDIGHRIVVSVDELMLITGAATKDDLTPFRSLTGGRLTELAAASRSCGMHLDMATQYGIAQAGGSSGSLMRFNLSGRMVVGASNPDGL
ncbi:MAG: hypothetical protein GY724_29135, partial [Actinomycetia bacterium]|nr:hypothetical protein [Actinomycetes bacterium]